jgi:hypothetical protein
MTPEAFEAKLKVILAQLFEVRLSIRENQGQGFLMNAESNIQSFLNFQQGLAPNKKLDTK